MKINLTLPVFNEAQQLADTVRTVLAFVKAQGWQDFELVIAENGSTDDTPQIADALAREHEAVTVRHSTTPGRGQALEGAWLASDADVLSYMDVDLSTDLSAYPALLNAVIQDGCDIAIGSRLSAGSAVQRRWHREIISRGYNGLARAWLGLRVRDAQCGFKAITHAAARKLLPQTRETGWFFDTELLALAQRLGMRIAEIPVHWTEDTDSRVRLFRTVAAGMSGIWRLRSRCGQPFSAPKA